MNEIVVHPVRRLGPTAWAVLEVLRDGSVATEGGLVAQLSIRGLALELGLAKNTIHRALRRLSSAGLIEGRQGRTTAGTFTSGHYVLSTNATDVAPTGPNAPRRVGRLRAGTSTCPCPLPANSSR